MEMVANHRKRTESFSVSYFPQKNMYCQKIIRHWYYRKIKKMELYDRKQINIGGELIILSQNTKP
jgi:hypothetical protein